MVYEPSQAGQVFGTTSFTEKFGKIPLIYTTPYFQGILLNHLLRSTSISGSYCWLALFYHSGNLNDGSEPQEPAESDNYSRVDVSGSWTITGASAVLKSDKWFNVAKNDWGKINYFGIMNGCAPGGNSGSFLFFGPLSASETVSAGESFVFLANQLSISISGGYSDYSASKLLSHYLNNVNFSTPTAYLGLYKEIPDMAGNGGQEISSSATYSRTNVTGNWSNPISSGSTLNTTAITYSPPAVDWGWVKGFCILNAATSGSILFRGDIYPRVYIHSGDNLKFGIGDISIIADMGNTYINPPPIPPVS